MKKSKEKITVGEITQKLTVLDVTVDGKNGKKVIKAVLEEMKDDKDVKKLLLDTYGNKNGRWNGQLSLKFDQQDRIPS